MKIKFYVFVLSIFCWTNLFAQAPIVFTDPNLKAYLINPTLGIDQNNDSEISIQEASNYTGALEMYNIVNTVGLDYFTSIESLTIRDSPITNLLSLPSVLKSLTIQGTYVSNLPLLPTSLQILRCDSNQIASLPVLPLTLTYLNCRKNNLSVLPELTPLLISLYCDDNQLTSLPTLPSNLTSLVCHNNHLQVCQHYLLNYRF